MEGSNPANGPSVLENSLPPRKMPLEEVGDVLVKLSLKV
jgi:hypothetical protein